MWNEIAGKGAAVGERPDGVPANTGFLCGPDGLGLPSFFIETVSCHLVCKPRSC